MKYQDLWPLIQRDILGVIQADDFLGARQGVLVEPGDIDSVIATKLAKVVGAGKDGRNGAGFLVLPIEKAEDDNVSLPGGPLKLTISIQWVENVIINQSATGTQIPIRVYAAQTEKILKLYTPVGLTQSLVPARPVISEFTDDTNKNLREGLPDLCVAVIPQNYAYTDPTGVPLTAIQALGYDIVPVIADNTVESANGEVNIISGAGGAGQYEHLITTGLANGVVVTTPIDGWVPPPGGGL